MMAATPKRPRVEDQIRGAAAELRRAGLTLAEIAGRLGVSGGLVSRSLRSLGIPPPPRDNAKAARRGVRNYTGTRPLPPWPTPAPPGTAEKVAVMEQRAAGGFVLFHPDDAAG